MANFVYIATSLDGFIATVDGGVDWLQDIPNPDNSDFGYSKFINSIDAIVMGRNTFDQVLTFGDWPYDKHVYVLSNKLKTIPDYLNGKVDFMSGDVKDVVKHLNHQGHTNLYIDGGLVIQSFLRADLIDELIITIVPILLGKGIPLFSDLGHSKVFKFKKTEIFNDMLVKIHYIRKA